MLFNLLTLLLWFAALLTAFVLAIVSWFHGWSDSCTGWSVIFVAGLWLTLATCADQFDQQRR